MGWSSGWVIEMNSPTVSTLFVPCAGLDLKSSRYTQGGGRLVSKQIQITYLVRTIPKQVRPLVTL